MASYDVKRIVNHMRTSRSNGWQIVRTDQPAHIGRVDTRREAILIARMLAGWRGSVSVNGKPRFGTAS
jgi:hypothetical protein